MSGTVYIPLKLFLQASTRPCPPARLSVPFDDEFIGREETPSQFLVKEALCQGFGLRN